MADVGLYLVEQYWPDVTRQRVQAGVAALSVDGGGPDVPSRVVAVLFLPDDECVFYLVEGESDGAVGVLVARTGRPADRVQRCEQLHLVSAGSPGQRAGGPAEPGTPRLPTAASEDR